MQAVISWKTCLLVGKKPESDVSGRILFHFQAHFREKCGGELSSNKVLPRDNTFTRKLRILVIFKGCAFICHRHFGEKFGAKLFWKILVPLASARDWQIHGIRTIKMHKRINKVLRWPLPRKMSPQYKTMN